MTDRYPPRVRNFATEKFDGGMLVDRRTPYGNPFRVSDSCSREEAVAKYRARLLKLTKSTEHGVHWLHLLSELHGKDLWCWCAPKPCHADVLLRAVGWAYHELHGGNRNGCSGCVS